MKLNNITPLITTADLAATKAFYTETLGFEVTFEHESYLGLRYGAEGGPELGFMRSGGEAHPNFTPGGLTYCLAVDNVDEEYKRLKDLDVPVLQEPQDNPWGDRSCIVADPLGIALYVCQPIEPTGEFADAVK